MAHRYDYLTLKICAVIVCFVGLGLILINVRPSDDNPPPSGASDGEGLAGPTSAEDCHDGKHDDCPPAENVAPNPSADPLREAQEMAIRRFKIKLGKIKQACSNGDSYFEDHRLVPADCNPQAWKYMEDEIAKAESNLLRCGRPTCE